MAWPLEEEPFFFAASLIKKKKILNLNEMKPNIELDPDMLFLGRIQDPDMVSIDRDMS